VVRAAGRGGAGWRTRVVGGRLRDQALVVLMVTAVAVAATTVVGLLAGLLHLAQTDAVRTALGGLDPDDVRIEATLWVDGKDTQTVLTKARAGMAEITGDVPTDVTTALVGPWHAVPRPDGVQAHMAYLATLPRAEGTARLVDGRWPHATTAPDGTVEVAVPVIAATSNGWGVGARIDAKVWDTRQEAAWTVVGTYEAIGPSAGWARDPLRGAGMDPARNVPGSAGFRTTVAWGPFLVDPSALDGAGTVDTAYLLAEPRLGEASRDAVAGLRERVVDGPVLLAEAIRPEARGRLTTALDDTVDAIGWQVAVARAGVVTTGLLLATLATTVMLLAARLLAERRTTENELLAARGASPRQLRSAVVLEALGLAALTWLVAPWAAQAALGALVRSGDLTAAGYQVGPGVPAPVLLACAAMAGVLAVALCVPAWHTAGSSTGTAHAGLLRAGADVVLLGIAAVALAQLVTYGSPVVRGTGGPYVDVVLVAGPALVVLAVATVALRLVAPVGRGADALAAGARSFVAPYAAWQVARRPAVASGTVLLVVVAVAAGSFSAAFGATWRTSQLEQVDLALGTDLRVGGFPDAPLTASGAVAAATADHPTVHAQPVVDRRVDVGPRDGNGGVSARLLAVDTSRPQDVRGRTGTEPADLLEGLGTLPPPTGTAAEVPPDTQWLVADVTVTTDPVTGGGSGLVHLVVEDDRGVVVQLAPRTVRLGERVQVAAQVPRSDHLRLVAVGAFVAPEELPDLDAAAPIRGSVRQLDVRLTLHGLHGVPRSAGVTHLDTAADTPGPAMTVDGDGWSGTVHQAPRSSALDVAGGLTPGDPERVLELTGSVLGDGRGMTQASLVASVGRPTTPVPAVVSRALLQDVDVREGGLLSLRVTGTPVDVVVQRVVDDLPGAPGRPALLVDHRVLAWSVLDTGGQPGLADVFWVTGPEPAVAAVADGFAGTDAELTSRAQRRATAVAGPVSAAVPAALSLLTTAAVVLVLIGVGTVAAAALRARRLELARLQALGASRHGLVGGLVVETTLLVVLAAAVGLLAGYGLSAVVAPLLTLSPDGRPPSPDPRLVWAWGGQAVRTTGLVVAACAVVTAVVGLGLRRASGAALRMGDAQ